MFRVSYAKLSGQMVHAAASRQLRLCTVQSAYSTVSKVSSSTPTLPHPVFTSPFPDANLPEETLPSLTLRTLAVHKEKIAFVNGFTGATTTNGQLIDMINQAAAGFAKTGLKEGDVVGLYMPNCTEFFVALMGATMLGASVSPINPGYEAREIAFQLRDSGATYVVAHAPLMPKLHEVLQGKHTLSGVELFESAAVAPSASDAKRIHHDAHQHSGVASVFVVSDGHGHRHEQHHGKGNVEYGKDKHEHHRGDRKHHESHVKHPAPIEKVKMSPFSELLELGKANPNYTPAKINVHKDVLVIPYSSGTTGLPKGVCLSHYNVVANLYQFISMEKYLSSNSDTFLAVLPFFHIYGFMIGLVALHLGIKTVIMERFDLQVFLENIQKHRVTVAHVAPPIVVALAKHPIVDKFDLKSLRQIFCGAAPLGSDLEAQVIQRLRCQVKQAYGMTELSPMCHINPDNKAKSGSIGVLAPNTKAKIYSHAKEEFVGANEEGELLIKGPQVMLGYLNRPDATDDTFADNGYLKTGDVAKVDDEGYFYIVDRVKELIKVKGYQVPPAELEGLLLTHPGISDSAVVGQEDEANGEVPVAFVVKKPTHKNLKEQEVVDYINAKVAHYKHLKGGVRFVEVVPKSASGKILRRILRDELKKEKIKHVKQKN